MIKRLLIIFYAVSASLLSAEYGKITTFNGPSSVQINDGDTLEIVSVSGQSTASSWSWISIHLEMHDFDLIWFRLPFSTVGIGDRDNYESPRRATEFLQTALKQKIIGPATISLKKDGSSDFTNKGLTVAIGYKITRAANPQPIQ